MDPRQDASKARTPQAKASPSPTTPVHSFLNDVTYLKNHYVFSVNGQKWIESQTGESVNFDTVFSAGNQHLESRWTHTGEQDTQNTHPVLPSRTTVEECVRRYSVSSQSNAFPVISQPLFHATLDRAYGPDQFTSSTNARACVFAFLSFISIFGFESVELSTVERQSYASIARTSLDSLIEEPTLDGLQTLVMLVRTWACHIIARFLNPP